MTRNDAFHDLEEAREKYRVERQKRVRSDGLDQYVHLEGDLAHLAEDPWAEPAEEREPFIGSVDAVLLGVGIGSLQMAAKLKQVGLKRVMLVDKAGDVRGTWYWNRYPGAQCDTESYVYLPFLEETGYIPTEKYAHQPEILGHLQRIARHFELYENALFQTEIQQARWDEETGEWEIRTDQRDVIRARYFVVSPGRLQSPKLPGIQGIEEFQGAMWHTSRWDRDYTGEDLSKLADKRVGIIGTGATGLQAIPRLAEASRELFVFQRTPSAVWIRGNRPTDSDWASSLEPGWQRRRMRNFTAFSSGILGPQDSDDMVRDGWTEIARWLSTSPAPPEVADYEVMERIRARVDAEVADPEVAEALKAYYRYGCKRPTFHDSFLPTFNLPSVHLIDTQGRGPDEIVERGVVVDGKLYELDCLVFATGFDLGMGFLYGTGLRVYGKGGAELTEKWAQGLRTLHGLYSAGFPNCFFLGFTQTAFSVNYTHMTAEQTDHLAYVVAEAERRHASIEAGPSAEAAWVEEIRSGRTPEERQRDYECTPGAMNNEGNPDDPNTLNAGRYVPGGNQFFERLEEWRSSGHFEGLVFSPR